MALTSSFILIPVDPSFEPTIVAGLGYTGNKAQLMSAPPFAVAFVGEFILSVSERDANYYVFSLDGHCSDIGSVQMPWLHAYLLLDL